MSVNLNPEFWSSVQQQIDEITTLKKSMDDKAAQEEEKPKAPQAAPEAGAEAPPASDEASDVVHAADQGDEGGLAAYAAKLSVEELQELLAALQAEVAGRGEADPLAASAEQAPPMEGGEPPPMDASAEAPPMDPAMDPGMDPAMPPEMGQEAGPESLQDSVAGLSDEELQNLMLALQQEQGVRGAGQPAPGAAAPMAPPAAAPAPEMDKGMGMPQDPMMMSKSFQDTMTKLSETNAALLKSVETMSERINKLETPATSAPQTFQKSVKAPTPSPSTTYADPKLKVLEKSSSAPQGRKLAGNELATWLLNEQRKGNPLVKSILVAEANLTKSDAEVDATYEKLKQLGINAPLVK